MIQLTPEQLAALPLGTAEAQAVRRNAGDLDRLLNGTGIVTTRTGAGVLTVREAIARMGLEAPVAFAAGLSIVRPTQTVVNGAVRYTPNPASLPFTTTATFNPAQWLTAESITTLSADLASTASGKGAALIGLEDTGNRWSATNLEAFVNGGQETRVFGGEVPFLI
ncbi:hypothetical protein [Sphaerotilus sp.]|uniref:hypothetical protein n=1 Tax=Sphaerotilus sp. TaxID=2093942 RepID=UPI002ACDBFE0|nr:hypothetical protein [Sphaerotilus sp.]MDZ7858651.1 hypothetical protein [Sphaerotilus sp.]